VTLLALAVLGLVGHRLDIDLAINQKNTWHRTPLDKLLIFWFIAFAISTAANWSAFVQNRDGPMVCGAIYFSSGI